MKVVIVGSGAVGFQIAKQLITEDKDVILIERDAENAKYAQEHLDCIVINDEGTDIEVLKSAGVETADFFISVTDSDEVNMVLCGLAGTEFNVPRKIARIRNREYADKKLVKKELLGIDYIVNPEDEVSNLIINAVECGADSDVKLFERTHLQMRNIMIAEGSILINKRVMDIKAEIGLDFLIACILRDETVIIPTGEMVIQKGDYLYLIAMPDTMDVLLEKLGRKRSRIRRIIIVGGGKIGAYIGKSLLEKGYAVKYIDKHYDKCVAISDALPDALVINADISDEHIFEDEKLADNDLIITTTSNQILNILTSIYAKSMGITRAAALVETSNYFNMALYLGVDVAVSMRDSSVGPILKLIRKGNIQKVHSILDGKAEVIEFFIENKNSITDMLVKDIRMPEGSLIMSVTRDDVTHIPTGNSYIHKGDTVVVISKKESISKVEELLKS
ncbi:Trk system potassium transporter TrkA [Spirochaetota bacterium]